MAVEEFTCSKYARNKFMRYFMNISAVLVQKRTGRYFPGQPIMANFRAHLKIHRICFFSRPGAWEYLQNGKISLDGNCPVAEKSLGFLPAVPDERFIMFLISVNHFRQDLFIPGKNNQPK
jgi:hypothetical protein